MAIRILKESTDNLFQYLLSQIKSYDSIKKYFTKTNDRIGNCLYGDNAIHFVYFPNENYIKASNDYGDSATFISKQDVDNYLMELDDEIYNEYESIRESKKIVKESFDINRFKKEANKIRFMISDMTADLDEAIVGGTESVKAADIVCLELQDISDVCTEIITTLTNTYDL